MQATKLSRRQWLQSTIAGSLAIAGSWAIAAGRNCRAVADPDSAAKSCTLSIGTYSTKGVPLEKAIASIADIGFDGIEIAAQPGYDGEPAQMPADRRHQVRQLLADRGLKLTALMEHLNPSADNTQHKADLDRLRRVLELSRELGPKHAPLIQTVLGGGKWEEKQNLFRDRLGDWQAAAVEAQVTLAIKPHRGGAMSRPSEAIWLIQQLGNSPRLRMVYDYSHYAFRQMPLEETIREALPFTAHIAVKDAVQQGDRVVFQLPGDSGTFDYAKLLHSFFAGGYRGDVCCEVSSMVSSQTGYDSLAAAKTCYGHMSAAFQQAQVPRA